MAHKRPSQMPWPLTTPGLSLDSLPSTGFHVSGTGAIHARYVIPCFLYLKTAQGFKLGSASGHVRRTLVPSHEGHIKIPLGGTLTVH